MLLSPWVFPFISGTAMVPVLSFVMSGTCCHQIHLCACLQLAKLVDATSSGRTTMASGVKVSINVPHHLPVMPHSFSTCVQAVVFL